MIVACKDSKTDTKHDIPLSVEQIKKLTSRTIKSSDGKGIGSVGREGVYSTHLPLIQHGQAAQYHHDISSDVIKSISILPINPGLHVQLLFIAVMQPAKAGRGGLGIRLLLCSLVPRPPPRFAIKSWRRPGNEANCCVCVRLVLVSVDTTHKHPCLFCYVGHNRPWTFNMYLVSLHTTTRRMLHHCLLLSGPYLQAPVPVSAPLLDSTPPLPQLDPTSKP